MNLILKELRNRSIAIVTSAGLLASIGACNHAAAAPEAKHQASQTPNVFQMPAYYALQQRLTAPIAQVFRAGRFLDAEKALRVLIRKYPTWPVHHYNLAATLARQSKVEEALDSLAKAIELGFRNKAALKRDPHLEGLRQTPRYQELLAKLDSRREGEQKVAAAPITPNDVVNGRATVELSNTAWIPQTNMLVSAFSFGSRPRRQKVHGGRSRLSRILNRWYAQSKAAGNHGDLYDNRDNGHSSLRVDLLPQLAHIVYGTDARAAKVHYGVNSQVLFNAITFGNSSTAVAAGPLWRSQPRLAMTTPGLIQRIYQQFINDHLYVYPEHRDHDAEHGDLIPANTPYMIISQGSSGSDQPFLHAIGAILAAFRPDVKAFLRKHHLVMSTVQMMFRSGLKHVKSGADYLSAKSHPSVFEADDLDIEKMIRLAQELRADAAPPQVRLFVVEESTADSANDFFGPDGYTEILFDTPGSIARVVRSTAYQRRMVISAAKTNEPNGRPLRFTWKVLRGDPDRIEIKPLDANATVVELLIPWHERRPVPFNSQLMTDRVDIAVFAHNGEQFSAPAFVSLLYPPNQERIYDHAGRLQRVRHDVSYLRDRYVDPVLFVRRGWMDVYDYDDDGRLVGWNRIRGDAMERFTRNGERVVETDAQGRPAKAERIRYGVKNLKSGLKQVIEIPTGHIVQYSYADETDRLGKTKL